MNRALQIRLVHGHVRWIAAADVFRPVNQQRDLAVGAIPSAAELGNHALQAQLDIGDALQNAHDLTVQRAHPRQVAWFGIAFQLCHAVPGLREDRRQNCAAAPVADDRDIAVSSTRPYFSYIFRGPRSICWHCGHCSPAVVVGVGKPKDGAWVKPS